MLENADSSLHVVWAKHINTLGWKIVPHNWILVSERQQLFCCCVVSLFYVSDELPCDLQSSVAFVHALCVPVQLEDAAKVCGTWCISTEEIERRRVAKVFAMDSVCLSELIVRVLDGVHTFIMSP